jgi:predicted transcriptional regulator
MNEALILIRERDKIDTGTLARLLDVDRATLFDSLNTEAKRGTVIRQGVLVENGTPRPTLCFGWSCPAH